MNIPLFTKMSQGARWWRSLVIAALAGLMLAPLARAQLSPDPGAVYGYANNNTALGTDVLYNLNLTSGGSNTGIGSNSLYTNIDGNFNTASGAFTLYSNDHGYENTATGYSALYSNTGGYYNTATGYFALSGNTTGIDNTATGHNALASNSTGNFNTATGVDALAGGPTTGDGNTATGSSVLKFNTSGLYNTAIGCIAMVSNSTGGYNTAAGEEASYNNMDGAQNVALGGQALLSNQSGGNNVAAGYQALYNCTGSGNIGLGFQAGYALHSGLYNIDIGNVGVSGDTHTMRIGALYGQTNTYVAGISGVTVASGVNVIIDTNGHLGTVVSSRRFKEAIQPMDAASESILALRPVTFRYKPELDPEGIPQFGLVAEEVEKVNPNLVARDKDGKVYTVRYEAVNAMLLNEFLKDHRKMEEQQATIAKLQSTADKQAAAIAEQRRSIDALLAAQKEQSAALQKVSAELELSKPARTTVASIREKTAR